MEGKNLWQEKPLSFLSSHGWAAAYFCCFVFWILLSLRFYSGPIGSQPVRLNATIDLWLNAPISRHWLLFFLNPNDAANGVPYNMPYLFSFFYAAYHVVLNTLTFGRWPFATTYLMTMIALFAASWFVLRPILEKASLEQRLLILPLAAGILVTSPYVTTFLFQANHDTSFTFNAIASTVLAFAIWQYPGRRSPLVWLALIYCSFSGLLGFVTLASCFLARKKLPLKNSLWLTLFGLCLFNLLFPMLLARVAFGTTSASSFLFRTGLDGSTQYFTSHWQALFESYQYSRSIERELSIKVFVAFALGITGWLHARMNYSNEAKAVGIALLPYVSHWIVFPQSVSIHPYLYDNLFLIPFDVGLVVLAANTLVRFEKLNQEIAAAVSFGAIALLIHDNLLLLAQGRLLTGA